MLWHWWFIYTTIQHLGKNTRVLTLVSSSGSTPVPTTSSLLVKDKWVTDYIQGGSVKELHSTTISWRICHPAVPSLPVLLPPNPAWSSQSDEQKNTECFWYERVNVDPPNWFFLQFSIWNNIKLSLSAIVHLNNKKKLLPSQHGLSITVSTVTSI